MEKAAQLGWWVRARSHHPAPGTLLWSLLLLVGQGKGGSREGTRGMMGMSSTMGAVPWSLPPPWGDNPQCQGQEALGVSPVCPSLRSIQGLDAGHPVLEAVGPQAGHVVIHDLHLAPGVARVLKQVDLVVSAVLGERAAQGLSPDGPQRCGHPSTAPLTIWRGRMDIRLSLLWLLDHESQRG